MMRANHTVVYLAAQSSSLSKIVLSFKRVQVFGSFCETPLSPSPGHYDRQPVAPGVTPQTEALLSLAQPVRYVSACGVLVEDKYEIICSK
jgi:hypothetical protein